MLTPAAKKRRVEAANAALKKPFRSPLVHRSGGQPATASTSSTTVNKTGSAGPFSGSRLSLSGPPSKGAEGAVEDDDDDNDDDGDAPVSSSPERFHKPARHHRPSPLPAGVVAGAAPRSGGHSAEAGTEAVTSGAGRLSALITRFERELDADEQALRQREQEVAEQDKRARLHSEQQRSVHKPQEEQDVDGDLKEVIQKWKAASRQAAEEVFGLVKQRVASAGGSKAWKEMRRRQQNFFAGFDDDSPTKAARRGSEGDRSEDLRSDDRYDEGGSDELEAQLHKDSDDEDGDGEEEEFTMTMMLASLNIDPQLLGYDETEDRWVD